MSSIEEVKRRIDIVEVIGAYVKLQRAGKIFKGLSPFKSERTPSFVVYQTRNSSSISRAARRAMSLPSS